MHAEGGFRSMLFDLLNDENELNDLGGSEAAEHQAVIKLMYERLAEWGRRASQRTTKSEQQIRNMRGRSRRRGIVLGLYDGTEAAEELQVKFKGSAGQRYTN